MAATGSQTLTSNADWQAGTADVNTEINLTPGDIKLKENKNIYTETTKEDFDAGSSPASDIVTINNNGGEVSIKKLGYLYTNTTSPSIGNGDSVYIYSSFLDSIHNLLYISINGGGLSVINTQGTVDSSDDVLVTTYTTSTSPAILNNRVEHAFIDYDRNLLYVDTWSGLSVINTQGTIDPSDDTLVITYTTSSTPSIVGNYVRWSFLDSTKIYYM
jgi:hypothetical protein